MSRFNLDRRDIGTGMNDEEVGAFTDRVHIPTLAGYYRAVGQKTREMVGSLRPEDLDEVPDPQNLRRALLAEGAIGEDLVSWIVGEREGNTKGWWLGLLGWGHNQTHRGEALTIRGMQGIRGR